MEKPKGFMAMLFDFKFKDFVTPRVISVFYVILVVLAGIGAIALIAFMFAVHVAAGIIALLILGPLYFFVSVLGYRVMLEVVMVIFRIRQDLADMRGVVRRGD
ncbi:MAG: DUF4282 domain-containing protein [Dehalococcoidia bacterium]